MELPTNEDLVIFLRAAVGNVECRRPAAALPALGGNPKGRLQRLMAKELKLTKELAVLPEKKDQAIFLSADFADVRGRMLEAALASLSGFLNIASAAALLPSRGGRPRTRCAPTC